MVRTRRFNINLYRHPDETGLQYFFRWCLNIKLQIEKQYLNLIDAPREYNYCGDKMDIYLDD